jgi:cell division protein FtsL
MKKSAKPLIIYSLAVFVFVSFFLLAYIGVKIRNDQLKKEIVSQEEGIASKKNRQMYLTARLQYYTSEERIINIAQTELGMIKREAPRLVLEVSKEKIDQIANKLKVKYD